MPYREENYKRVQSKADIGGRTKSSFQFDADPNRIMKQFNKTGDLDLLNQTKKIALHGDFSQIPDFFTALLQVQKVEEDFMELPSKIRNHVDNDASKLMELLADPARVQEAIDLGLVADLEVEAIPIPLPTPAAAEPTPTPEEGPETPIQGGD